MVTKYECDTRLLDGSNCSIVKISSQGPFTLLDKR